jgi:hypothetical protein
MKPLGRTPLTIRRKPSPWPGIRTQVVITAAATAPDQCSQVRVIGSDQPTPDTLRLDMYRCLTIDQDFSRIFLPDELERMPEVIRNGGIDNPAPGQQGYVVAEVVVDSAGRPETSTFRALTASEPGLIPNAQSAVLGSFYRPGEAAGRRVRVRLQIPMGFTIRR